MSNCMTSDITEFLGDGYQPGGSCTSDDESIRKQFPGSEQLRTAIGGMLTAYKEWGPVQQRADSFLYKLLGNIYAACPIIESSAGDKAALIAEVRKHKDVPNIGERSRWDPYKESAEQLFLTLLFGLKDRRSTKTQWLKALRAAKAESVERNVEAFVAWCKQGGGVVGAGHRRPGKKADQEKIVTTLADFVGDNDSFQKPITLSLEDSSVEFPQKLGVVIVRQLDEAGQFQPLATVSDQRLIAAAIEAHNKERQRLEKECQEEAIRDHDEKWKKPAKKKWRKFTKDQRERLGSFEDWLAKGRPYNLDSLPEA